MATTTDAIQEAYASAEAWYTAANPGSQAAHEAATAHLPGGNTRSVLHWAPYPLSIASAAGYTLRDADGHAYVDLLGEYSAGLYGHSHPTLLAALERTARNGLSYGGTHAGEARLAALVRARFPSAERLRFTNSGTEANLLALAAAKAFTRRPRGRVLVFEGAYHGGVLAFPFGCRAVWGGGGHGKEEEEEGGRKKFEVLRALNAPHDFLVATYNDTASVDAALARGSGGGDGEEEGVAAILVEPMLGSGGGVRATPAFLAHLRRRADETGALLILDEVMTSRLFAGGGVQGEPGACGGGGGGAPLRPDLTTLGKYVGGGMPCGAFGGRADVMALFDPRHGGPGSLPHAGTFNNNVLTMNVGAAGLEAVFTPDAARALHRLGDDVRDRINALALASETGAKRGVRVLGCGSLLVFHFTRTPLARIASPADWAADEDPRLLDLLHLEMLRAGFYLARRGYAALCLPLLAPEGRAALDRFVDAVGAFLARFRELIEG